MSTTSISQSLLDKYLDNLEARIAHLEENLLKAQQTGHEQSVKESSMSYEEEEEEEIPKKKPALTNKNGSTAVNNNGLIENDLPSAEISKEILISLGNQLQHAIDSGAYVKAKQWLIESLTSEGLVDLIRLAREMREQLSHWDRIASCVLAALKDASTTNEYYVDLEVYIREFESELTILLELSEDGGGLGQRTTDLKLLKRILEVLPPTSPCRIETCERLAWTLCTRPSPSFRAMALDLASLAPSDDFAKRIAVSALEIDAHRLVEEAARRLASSSADRELLIGHVLVSYLLKYRGEDVVFISRTAKRFNVEHMFEGLGERGEQERIKSMIKQGVNKALGMVTLRPEKKWVVLANLVEEGHHLTARRIARNRPNDDQMLLELFGVEIDDDAAERERQLRCETCVRLPENVPVHWIDNLETLSLLQEEIIYSQGPIAMDVEWLPEATGQKGFAPAQIIQLAREQAVYLLDVAPGSKLRSFHFHQFMLDLLNHVHQVWGFGLEMDCKVLARSFPMSSWCNLLRARSRNVALTPQESLKSLAERVLNKTVDKEQQMSNWGRRPLYEEQIEYAATDAYVLLLLQKALFAEEDSNAAFVGPPVVTQTEEGEGEKQVDGSELKFFCDETLKRVAKMLRSVNVDCAYEHSGGKRTTAIRNRLARCKTEGRIFLTTDNNLRGLRGVYVVHATDNEERFRELVQQFHIPLDTSLILLRCTKCNGPGFEVISKDEARRRKPEVVTDYIYSNESIGEFFSCTTCRNVVWQGKKFKEVHGRMERLIESTTSLAQNNTGASDGASNQSKIATT